MVLGIVQGLTEFLPVSSSGHLVLGAELLGLQEPQLFFDIMVHVATLVATCIFYRRDLYAMLGQTLNGFGALRSGTSWGDSLRAFPHFRFSLLVIAGSVPTAIIGFAFKDYFEGLFHQPKQAAGMLLVTAFLLLLTRFSAAGEKGLGAMPLKVALLVGLSQGFAIIPGISRSGTTIACAILLGIEREHAARFSFLLAIPAICGALLLELKSMASWEAIAWMPVGLGFVSAALTGLLALRLLVPVVHRGVFHYFGFYLVPAGIAGLVFLP